MVFANLLPADYAWCAVTAVLALLGLVRGFSGTLGFLLAVVAAVAAAVFGWDRSAVLTDVTWMRAAGVLVATLLVFGLVRLVVKKLVNGLLAQPADALFGSLIGAVLGLLLLVAWARSGLWIEYSALAKELSAYVR